MEQTTTAVAGAVTTSTLLAIEPVTRVGGAIGLRLEADPRSRRYSSAHCAVNMFRGYEGLITGRQVDDAIYLSSRCCGYHGGQHSVASAQAIEMAVGLTPPPMAVAIRNLGLAAETIHAEAAHLVLMVAPDLCEQTVRANWPGLWSAAERAEAPHAEIHGMGTIGEIMYALNPWTGRWYLEALKVARVPFTMYAIMAGKYPHPQTMVPGGLSVSVGTTRVHDYLIHLLSLVDPAKRIATMIVDLLDFCLATVPELRLVGAGPMNFIDSGQFDDPEGYDASEKGLKDRGDRRWAAPGLIIDGRLVSSDLGEIAAGIRESTAQSYYEGGAEPQHPYDRVTRPRPANGAVGAARSWSTTVTWQDGTVVETGPGARLWATALRGSMPPNPFITAANGGVQLDLPEGALPRLVLEWRPPASWNAIERNRARLYSVVFAALTAANQVLKVLDLQKEARLDTATKVRIPKVRGSRRGVGLAGDGLLGHWLTLSGNRVENYQVVAPSTINLGPGGPAEQAIQATPYLGDAASGLEALIALRSFDPCGNCASH